MDTPTATPDQQQTTPAPDSGGGWQQAASSAAGTVPQEQQPAQNQTQPGQQQPPQTPAPQVTALPAPPQTAKPVRPGGIRGFIDRMVDSLAGTDTSRVRQDPQGNIYIKHENLSRGQQWLRIGAEALSGAAAGLAQRGAGSKGQAAAAGFEAGQKFRQQDTDQNNQQLLQLANISALNHQIAANALELTRKQVEGQQHDIEFSEHEADRLTAQGATIAGHAANLQELTKFMRDTPNFNKDQVQSALYTPVATYGADGKANGFDIYKKIPGSDEEMLPKGTKVPFFDPITNEIKYQNSAGPIKQGDLNALAAAAGNARHKYQLDQAEINERNANAEEKKNPKAKPLTAEEASLKRAEAFKDYQEGRKAKMEAENAEPGKEDVESQAQALVDRRTAPSLLPKRGNTYNEIMRLANEKSLQQKGVPYDQTEGEQGYEARKNLIKDFTDGQAAQTIESFDKFLGHTQAASTAANALRNTNLTLLNTPINALRKMGVGKAAELQTFLIAHDTARKEFETALKNNHALTVEDVKTGEKLSNENLTPAQMQATYKEMANVAATRLRATDFRYSRSTGHHVPDLISPEGEQSLQHFGIDPKSVYSQNVRTPAAAGGMINVQIPGQPAGQIPASAVEQFKKDHPNAVISQ